MREYKLSDDNWDESELNAIQKVIKSARFSMGQEVKNFEKEFAEKFGVKYAVMVNSGSSANLLAVASLFYSGKLNRGDEIIVPAVSWSTTYFPLQQYGLKVKFVDINLETLNLDINLFKKSISEKTKAVFIVNLLGNPNSFHAIKEITQDTNIIILEDNCEAMGATYKGKQLGSFGLIGTYSTFYSHHICTMEGGVCVTDDEELYHYMLSIRAHGWTRNLPRNSKIYHKNSNEFYESFNFILPGYNLRPLEIEAAIGREQLKKLDRIIYQRRENAKYFKHKMSQIPDILIQKEIGESSWFGFSIILIGKNKGRRDQIIKVLKKNNIEVRPIVAGNFTKNEVIKYFNYEIYDSLINADIIHENGFFIGNHSKSNKEQVEFFSEVLSNAILDK